MSDTIEALARGTLETRRTSHFSLGNGGVGLGTISAAVPRSFKAEIEDVRAEIVAGKIPIASSVTSRSRSVSKPRRSRPRCHVGRRVANRNEAYNPTVLRIDLDDGAVGVVGHEHHPIRRAHAHEPSANRGRLSHRSRVRVDVARPGLGVRDPDSLLPGRQRDGYSMGTSAVAVFVCGSMRSARSAAYHPECLLAECQAYRAWPTSMIAEGSFVVGRCEAHGGDQRRSDGIVIGVDRVGRVPTSSLEPLSSIVSTTASALGSMRETVPSLPFATQTASVATARSIAGAPIPIVLMTSWRS